MNPTEWLCDGCGQPASPEHIARRLQRLEWTTRFRPVHIGALLLGAVAPKKDSEFLYSPGGDWRGEGKLLLAAAGVSPDGKSAEAALAEFQRAGFLVTHVLECPLEGDPGGLPGIIATRLPVVLTRIRRSLKPKRLALISGVLQEFLPAFAAGELPCSLLLDGEKPFSLDRESQEESVGRLRDALATRTSHAIGL
jgi:hypothetical protein